jgi:hypothetical protein
MVDPSGQQRERGLPVVLQIWRDQLLGVSLAFAVIILSRLIF